MGVFDDKKFEQLDWMTQITETIESELNNILKSMPDRHKIDISYVRKAVAGYSPSIWGENITRELLRSTKKSLSWEEETKIAKCFRLEADGPIEIDASSDTMTGELYLVKVMPTLEDSDLQGLMGSKGILEVAHINQVSDNAYLSRLNEVLDILGSCEKATQNRSFRKKINAICNRLRDVFSKNEWRIRDMGLADKVGFWIKDYIETGNLAAFTNLCKIKVMTHNNMPIYSIEEEK